MFYLDNMATERGSFFIIDPVGTEAKKNREQINFFAVSPVTELIIFPNEREPKVGFSVNQFLMIGGQRKRPLFSHSPD